MGKLTKALIKEWIALGVPFDGRSDGGGLTLRYRENDTYPRWIFRYSIGGRPKTLDLGTYNVLSLEDARKAVVLLRARVASGIDVAREKKDRVEAAKAYDAKETRGPTVADLADQYWARSVNGRWKNPMIVRRWIDNKINPAIGSVPLSLLAPGHIDQMLETMTAEARNKGEKGTVATKVLRCTTQILNYGMKRELLRSNPAALFDASDAGGDEEARERWLTKVELEALAKALGTAPRWNASNDLTVRLLLLLPVRKMELVGARLDEFDLEQSIWRLPEARTKTGVRIDYPLSHQVVKALRLLVKYGNGSEWLLPARKAQSRRLPHISPDTINSDFRKKIGPLMSQFDHFTIHDFRRTSRTHLEALGIAPHVSERCLNHVIKGVAGVYNRWDYFEERKQALQKLADFYEDLGLCKFSSV